MNIIEKIIKLTACISPNAGERHPIEGISAATVRIGRQFNMFNEFDDLGIP